MPVQRFRAVEDLPEPEPAADALRGLAAACATSTMSRAFGHARQAPRGVRRFRSFEEADARRQRWEAGEDPDVVEPSAAVRSASGADGAGLDPDATRRRR